MWILLFFPMMVMARNSNPLTNKPVAVFRSHGISAKVFENFAKDDKEMKRPIYRVRTERTYKVKDAFQSSPVFTRDEVMIANELNLRAWREILNLEEAARNSRFDDAEA